MKNPLRYPPTWLIAAGMAAGLLVPAAKSSDPQPANEPPPAAEEPGEIDLAAARSFWSFQPVAVQPLPEISQPGWPRTRIDYFVLHQLDQRKLTPSPPADRQTFMRRVCFDLIGLPPTWEQAQAFVEDPAPDAEERLVDRLLASPQYGERWGRHWLDLARYAEDHPNGAPPPRFAHRYRDWVVQALNQDLPYDEFVRRQLAADHVPSLPLDELAALGFLGLSPAYALDEKFSKEVVASIVAEEWEERIDLITRGLLGLTVACARCHDHKYDPITTADYYALAGVLASTQLVERPTVPLFDEDATTVASLMEDLRFHQSRYEARKKQREGLIRTKEPDVYRYDKEILESASEIQRIHSLLPPGYEKMPRVNAVRDAALRINDEHYVIRELVSPEARFWTRIEYEAGAAQDVAIQVRGNVSQLGLVAPRRFLEALSRGTPRPLTRGSGRLDLAEAIVSDAAPLTARVIVNRVWGWHFGQPIVRTLSNFGELGERPSHPELLDDLAARFISDGWSLKRLHREIVLSATYRQSSQFRSDCYAVDPDNILLWRMNRQRLSVEAWRDAMLLAAGRLDQTVGGPSANVDDPSMNRRTLYAKTSRADAASVLQTFDCPETTRHVEQRSVTTTPLQQLFFLNSPFVLKQASAIAHSASGESPIDGHRAIREVYRRILARDPTSDESRDAERLLDGLSELSVQQRWAMLTQSLLVSNEFLFVD
ncbi:MAG: DUF1553 domain-containing protein [Planctomycetes bacterium]|nr:DUF1553 domain-containing protein [Planctomycetota bacterium]